MFVYNNIPRTSTGEVDESAIQARAYQFAADHYSGIIKSGGSPTSFEYADGTIHVMLIDNTNNTIKSMAYDYKFDYPTPTLISSDTDVYEINRAYYDDYQIQVRFANATKDDFKNNTVSDTDYADLSHSINAKTTVFSILATTVRNHTEYSFLTHASLSMVNIVERQSYGHSGLPVRTYYTIGEVPVFDAHHQPVYDPPGSSVQKREPGIVDMVDSSLPAAAKMPIDVNTTSAPADGNYCIIYSYTTEINNS